MDKYEELDASLERAKSVQTNWVMTLQDIRMATDAAYSAGEITQNQWQALITKSARIQDSRNGD